MTERSHRQAALFQVRRREWTALRRYRLPPPDPKQVLEARFAAGEIDERQFHRRMHALVYGPPLELELDAGDERS